MNEKEKPDIANKLEKHFDLNLPEFYKELNKAISENNREQSHCYYRYCRRSLPYLPSDNTFCHKKNRVSPDGWRRRNGYPAADRHIIFHTC